MKKKFAVVRLWKNLATAETENIARLKMAAQNLGLECTEIFSDGTCPITGKKISHRDVDFAIHLHFETPKNYDIFSFVALWNPLQYYFDWGYEKFSKHLVSHDDFLSCSSTGADDHIKRLIFHEPLHLPPLFKLYHSVASPIFSPVARSRELMYIGINWERFVTNKSRHESLIKKLDATGNLKIYGPRIFQKVNVWKGYRGYVGELPFDGESVIKEIHSVGASLVLSSDAHKESELMSNRLFETIAAGSIPICDENPFAKRFFGDSVLYIDAKSPTAFEDILAHLNWINQNPELAKDKILAAQKILKNEFDLESSLQQIYRNFEARKLDLSISLNGSLPKVALVWLFCQESDNDLERILHSCRNQDYPRLTCYVFLDPNSDFIEAAKSMQQSNCNIEIIPLPGFSVLRNGKRGRLISAVLDVVKNKGFDFFCIASSSEFLFQNHIRSLVNICKKNKEPCVAMTACVVKYENRPENFYEYQGGVEWSYDLREKPIGAARFLFSKETITETLNILLPYLDKKAFCALIGNQKIVSSSLVTLVLSNSFWSSNHWMSIENENKLIRDLYRDKFFSYSAPGFVPKLVKYLDNYKVFIKSKQLPSWVRKPLRKIYYWIKRKASKQ